MKGWTEHGTHTPSLDPVFQCTAALCGAYVRVQDGDDRRAEHDREFHLVRAERGGAMDGRDLYFDGKRIGYAYIDVQRYNLVRLIVSRTWVARLDTGNAGGHERFRDTMDDVVKAVTGAKAWGEGKDPKVWHYPEEAR